MPLKRLLKSLVTGLLVAACLWTAPATAAGTTPLALVPQVDSFGNKVPGCLLYFFVAGTVASPQNAYSDFGLTQNPNPVLQCDQAGRVPMHWLADGLIHIRLTDSAGLVIVDTTMQVLGPSSGGGGGGGTVDPTSIFSTGNLKADYGTGPLSGFVRCNGLTIGNATSGATERANADTQPLFIRLYSVDPNLAVSGGRTGNALNDYNAGKTIALPDWRGRALAFLDDMGNGLAGRLTATFFGTAANVLGASGGAQQQGLSTANLPPYTPAGGITNGTITMNGTGGTTVGGAVNRVVDGDAPAGTANSQFSFSQAASTFAGTAQGGTSTGFSVVQPTMLATLYIKL